jgi:hypothetical protein
LAYRLAAPTPHAGKAHAAAPAASRGDSVDNHRGMHRQSWLGTTRIAQNELAAMNRFVRFPET